MNPDAQQKVFQTLDDIGVKVTLAVAGTVAAGAAIVIPSSKQVETASQDLYGRAPQQLLPHERKAAEFTAGYRRWKGFAENSVYSWTRKLPGHDNPVTNPYKGPRKLHRKQEEKLEQEVEAAAKAE